MTENIQYLVITQPVGDIDSTHKTWEEAKTRRDELTRTLDDPAYIERRTN